MTEEWERVRGHPDYEVSDLGQVRSWKRPGPPRILKQSTMPKGYKVLALGVPGRLYLVHRLVLDAFVGPPPFPKAVTRHLNNRPGDNRAVNLAWGTQKQNMEDRVPAGTDSKGVRHGNARLTEADAVDIRQRYSGGETGISLAGVFGVSCSHIYRVIHGQEWGHVQTTEESKCRTAE